MADTISKDQLLAALEEYGAPLEDWTKVPVISEEDEIDETMSIPGVKYSTDPTLTNNAEPENFVQLHLAALFGKINTMLQNVRDAITALTTLKGQTEQARDAANEKAGLANSKATAANTAAENANSIWNTVKSWFLGTNNNGFKNEAENFLSTAREQESGRVTEYAGLKRDAQSATSAANTAAGNANEKAGLANEKANLANEKAGLANEKANLANEKAGLANEKASLANEKALYAERQGDRAKAFNDNPMDLRDDGYIWVWDETVDNGDGTVGAMVRTNKMVFSFSGLTEEQKQSMITQFYASVTYASKETCEAIVDALT